jgi:hypothetical protein
VQASVYTFFVLSMERAGSRQVSQTIFGIREILPIRLYSRSTSSNALKYVKVKNVRMSGFLLLSNTVSA